MLISHTVTFFCEMPVRFFFFLSFLSIGLSFSIFAHRVACRIDPSVRNRKGLGKDEKESPNRQEYNAIVDGVGAQSEKDSYCFIYA